MGDDQATGTGGLRRRLTLAFLLVGLLPAAVAGFLGVRQSLHAAHAARLESEERLVALSAEGIAATLRSGLSIIRAGGEEESLRRATLAGDRKGLAGEVRSIQQHSPDFASVLVLDATGIALANSLDPAVVGRDFKDRDYYQGVLRSRAPYISPVPYVGAATRVPTLAIASPIRASRGGLLGVLVGTFTLEHLSHLLAPAGVVAPNKGSRGGDQGEVYLVSPSGVILAHSDPGKRATTVEDADAGAREALAGRRGFVVLLGADGVMADVVVNKVGTGPLLHAAQRAGVPAFVLADASKWLPEGLAGVWRVREEAPEEIARPCDPTLRVHNRYFGTSPLPLVTGVVWEGGVARPADVRRRITRLPVSKGLVRLLKTAIP